jgi:hypothetical protein
MARSVEGSSRSSASVEEVWAVWTDPAGWLGGPIEAAELHDTFEVGSEYTTKLKGYSPATATIARTEAPRLWTSVVGRPGLTTTVEHVIEPVGDETPITEQRCPASSLDEPVRALAGWGQGPTSNRSSRASRQRCFCQACFRTLPALRQRVQTYSRRGVPPTSMRTFCRFGLKRRLVATIEWLRLCPNAGPFLHE